MIFKNHLKDFKRKCFSVLRQRQSCTHEVKNGCKNLQRFSFKPLKPFYLSSEQGFKSHDGPGVTLCISDELNFWDIQGNQVEGGNFSGQYFRLSLPMHLPEAFHFSDQFICKRDPLHKRSIVDNHIHQDSSFSWLVKTQTIYREIFFYIQLE